MIAFEAASTNLNLGEQALRMLSDFLNALATDLTVFALLTTTI
jgi:hypothetical protein